MNLLHDLHYIARLLLRDRRFSILSLTVIALGISVALCVYYLTYGIYERPLPFDKGDRVVIVKSENIETGQLSMRQVFNGFTYHQLKESVVEFEELGAMRFRRALLSNGESAILQTGVATTPNLIAMTDVRPILGRLLQNDDALPEAEPVVLISERLWQNYYAGDEAIVGRQTVINGRSHTIVGVLPNEFRFPEVRQSVWFPLSIPASASIDDNVGYTVVGMLAEQVSLRAATRRANQVIGNIALENPLSASNRQVRVQSYARISEVRASEIQPVVMVLGLVLFLLAAINLNALLFVRSLNRRRELSIRFCLGASRLRIIRFLWLESFLLCGCGTVLGLFISQGVLSTVAFLRSNAPDAAGAVSLELGLEHLGPLLVIISVIWLLPSAAAAIRILVNIKSSTTDVSSITTSERTKHHAMRTIIGAQVILTCTLLIVCGLMTNSIVSLYQTDFGADNQNAYVGQFSLFTSRYQSDNAKLTFINTLQQQLLSVAEIDSVSFTTAAPSRSGIMRYFNLPDQDPSIFGERPHPRIGSIWVSDNYFKNLGVPLLEGRWFDQGDSFNSQPVVIIDQKFAQSLWPGQPAVGKQIQLDPDSSLHNYTVVGVTDHLIQASPIRDNSNRSSLYFPLTQEPQANLSILIKTNTPVDINYLTELVRSKFSTVDRQLPIAQLYTLDDFQEIVIDDWGVIGLLFTLIATTALILSIIGIYGLIARSVLMRTIEIGIRRSLGSSTNNILQLFLRQSGRYLLIGLLFGVCSTLLISDYLMQLFPSIFTSLPWIIAAVFLLMACLVMLATYIPSKKALALEPGKALRHE